MKASNFEFRFRTIIIVTLYALGFWAPWERYSARASAVTSTWLELIGAVASAHWLSLNTATLVITWLAIAAAFAGAALRVWGTAYLGAATMQATSMQAGQVVAAGPYRHLRNPLYVGSYFTALAVAILMPPEGAIFFVIAMAVFELRLVLGEEAFLASRLNGPFVEYLRRVPRILPSLWPRTPASTIEPRWLEGLLVETCPVALACCFAALAWRYNSQILTQAVIICFGASLMVRAILPKRMTVSA